MASDDGRANGSGDENGEEVKVSSLQSSTTAPAATPTNDLPIEDHTDAPHQAKPISETVTTANHTPAEKAVREEFKLPPSDISTADPTATESIAELKAQLADLKNQVSDLNGKLVTSFMRVSDLEDDLSEAKERAMAGTTRVAELEKERQEHLAALNTGLLVEKAHVSSEMQRMMDRVIEETKQRGQAESDKAKIESELDELSASLFGEANRMVAVEKLARARAEEKSRQMEERLQDTEGIMLEQQKVLGDLQRQLDSFRAAEESKNDQAEGQGESTDTEGKGDSKALTASSSRRRQASPDSNPYQDRRFLMLDIVPYQELRSFLNHLRKLRVQLAPFYNYPYEPRKASNTIRQHSASVDLTTSNRAASPAMNSTLSSVASLTTQPLYTEYHSSTQTSPFAIAGVSRHKDYPTLPSNCEQLVHISSQLSLPFIKRAQEEDSDPCLRMDFAPGLNWLTRRSANTSVLDGNLLIEPLFPGGIVPNEEAVREQYQHSSPAACAMCGMLLVNVPLPANEESKSASVTPDLRTVSGWASSVAAATNSAALSLREAAGSSTQKADGSDKPALKTSRSGLFGSLNALRSKTGSPKPHQQAQATIGEVDGQATPQSPSTSTATPAPVTELDYGTLPIPTHIFRISETSTARYLLCPHHCLVRLRAACAFWGYLRHIERAVVLEGKLAWDDEANAASVSGVVKPQPRRAQLSPSIVVEGSLAEGQDGVEDKDAVTDRTSDAEAPPPSGEDTATPVVAAEEKLSSDPAIESDDAFHDAGAVTPSGEEGSTKGSAEELHSLPSKDKPQHLSLPEAVQDGIIAEQGTLEPASPGTSTRGGVESQSSADATTTTTTTGSSTPVTAPSLPASAPIVPPRRARPTPIPASAAAVPATATGTTAPPAQQPDTLPPLPRRPTNPSTAPPFTNLVRSSQPPAPAPPQPPPPPSGSPPPPPRKELRIDAVVSADEKPLIWEEKVYLEVLRLKRMMWEARIGVKE